MNTGVDELHGLVHRSAGTPDEDSFRAFRGEEAVRVGVACAPSGRLPRASSGVALGSLAGLPLTFGLSGRSSLRFLCFARRALGAQANDTFCLPGFPGGSLGSMTGKTLPLLGVLPIIEGLAGCIVTSALRLLLCFPLRLNRRIRLRHPCAKPDHQKDAACKAWDGALASQPLRLEQDDGQQARASNQKRQGEQSSLLLSVRRILPHRSGRGQRGIVV